MTSTTVGNHELPHPDPNKLNVCSTATVAPTVHRLLVELRTRTPLIPKRPRTLLTKQPPVSTTTSRHTWKSAWLHQLEQVAVCQFVSLVVGNGEADFLLGFGQRVVERLFGR